MGDDRERLQSMHIALEAALEQLTYAQQHAVSASEIGQEPPPEVSAIERALAEVGGSGKSGDGLIVQVDDDLSVELLISPSSAADDQPAHIHTGTCAALGAVVHPLTNVVDGMSATTLAGINIGDVADGAHAIAVHESAANMQNIIACGDIPMYVP